MNILVYHAVAGAELVPDNHKVQAKVYAYHLSQEAKEYERELVKKNAKADEFLKEKAMHEAEIYRLSRSQGRHN
jgi:hypothetical protein